MSSRLRPILLGCVNSLSLPFGAAAWIIRNLGAASGQQPANTLTTPRKPPHESP